MAVMLGSCCQASSWALSDVKIVNDSALSALGRLSRTWPIKPLFFTIVLKIISGSIRIEYQKTSEFDILRAMKNWKQELQQAISDPDELQVLLDLPAQSLAVPKKHFPLRVPRSFVRRMQKGNPNDPLLLQVFIAANEFEQVDGYDADPLQEATTNPIPGLLHKYHGRVLIVLSGSCAINCRYCFRRAFPYNDNSALKHWPQIIEYLKNHHEISEVILSGGDPLLVDDEQLASVIRDVEAIPHITTLRIHTRLPVVIPSRITDEFIDLLSRSCLQTVVVLHINHANEIDDELSAALLRLKSAAIVLNQAVLLKNINDSVDALESLSRRLFAAGVLPYYVHQLDRVVGAHHFYVSQEQGVQLMAALQARLPGYLVPRYVQEVPGKPNKMPI